MTNAPDRPTDKRPLRDEKIEVRVTHDEKIKLVRLAKELGMTTSGVVRMAIELVGEGKIGEYWPDAKDQEK